MIISLICRLQHTDTPFCLILCLSLFASITILLTCLCTILETLQFFEILHYVKIDICFLFILCKQLRQYLNEIMLDQLPILADMHRYLEHLSMMEPPSSKQELILEQVLLTRDGHTGQLLLQRLFNVAFCDSRFSFSQFKS